MTTDDDGVIAIELQPPARPLWRNIAIAALVVVAVNIVVFRITGPLLDGSGVNWSGLIVWALTGLPFLIVMLRHLIIGHTLYLDEDGVVYPREVLWPKRVGWHDVESIGLDGDPPWTTGVLARMRDGSSVFLMHVEAADADSPRVRHLIDAATARIDRYRESE